MARINYPLVEAYIREIYPSQDKGLEDLEDFARENSVPIIGRESLEFLKTMIRIYRPKRILELGTAIGYSAIQMALLDDEIIVTTLDRSEKFTPWARDNIKNFGLEDRIEIVFGEIDDNLKTLEGPYDLFFFDAGKSHYLDYFEGSKGLMKRGSLIISDNVLFKGQVPDPSLARRRDGTIIRNMDKYLRFLTHTKGLHTSLIPLGDGMAITIVEEMID